MISTPPCQLAPGGPTCFAQSLYYHHCGNKEGKKIYIYSLSQKLAHTNLGSLGIHCISIHLPVNGNMALSTFVLSLLFDMHGYFFYKKSKVFAEKVKGLITNEAVERQNQYHFFFIKNFVPDSVRRPCCCCISFLT